MAAALYQGPQSSLLETDEAHCNRSIGLAQFPQTVKDTKLSIKIKIMILTHRVSVVPCHQKYIEDLRHVEFSCTLRSP